MSLRASEIRSEGRRCTKVSREVGSHIPQKLIGLSKIRISAMTKCKALGNMLVLAAFFGARGHGLAACTIALGHSATMLTKQRPNWHLRACG